VPDRLAINLLNTAEARIRVMGYFAVTSNTVQFGARAELFFGLDEVSIEGHLAFDALFQFSPFYFIVEISASVSLKVFGLGLFSVRLRGSLEGPTPWRVAGAASISFFFFEISVDFEHTWGESADTTLPGTRVMELLTAELAKETSWRAEVPASSRLLVSLRQLEPADDELVLHPLGALRVSQRAVPLEITVDKVGNQKASDANRFHLQVDDGGGLGKRGDGQELFAIAQYQELDNSQKLSLPAFQPEPGGVVLAASGDQLRSSRMVKRRVRYELIILDSNFKRFARPFFEFWRNLFVHFARGSVITASELSQRRRAELQPFDDRIAVEEPGFTVARTRDNTPWAAEARRFGSEAEAREYLRRQVATDRKLARELHVIPAHEVNEAA
jgi:hypothetical protein